MPNMTKKLKGSKSMMKKHDDEMKETNEKIFDILNDIRLNLKDKQDRPNN